MNLSYRTLNQSNKGRFKHSGLLLGSQVVSVLFVIILILRLNNSVKISKTLSYFTKWTFAETISNDLPWKILLVIDTNSIRTHRPLSTSNDLSLNVNNLFEDLRNSYYDGHRIDLKVTIVPPASDHSSQDFNSILSYFRSQNWAHGEFQLSRSQWSGSFGQVLRAWKPNPKSHERVVLVDGVVAQGVSPHWYRFARHSVEKFLSYPDVVAIAVRKPHDPPMNHTDRDRNNCDFQLWEGAHDDGIIIPTSAERWVFFLNWFERQSTTWYLWPNINGTPHKSDPLLRNFNSTELSPWNVWLTRFSTIYNVFTAYPIHSDLTFSTRQPFIDSTNTCSRKDIKRFFLNGTESIEANSSVIPTEVVEEIFNFSQLNGNFVSLTVVTDAYVPFALNWLCNVEAGGMKPPGLVIVTADEVALNAMNSTSDSLTVFVPSFKGGKNGPRFGFPSYWILMLERSFLVRDLLDRGVEVFLFDLDQVWLRDPFPQINRLRAEIGIDLIGTLDTTYHDIGGNFLIFRPTFAIRKLYNDLCKHFDSQLRLEIDGKASNQIFGVDNDQSILTKLVMYDRNYRANYPVVFRALDRELFVSGKWYFNQDRLSFKEQSPTVINVNVIIGIEHKLATMKKFGQFFLKNDSCDSVMVQTFLKNNSIISNLSSEVDGTKRSVGEDTFVGLNSLLK